MLNKIELSPKSPAQTSSQSPAPSQASKPADTLEKTSTPKKEAEKSFFDECLSFLKRIFFCCRKEEEKNSPNKKEETLPKIKPKAPNGESTIEELFLLDSKKFVEKLFKCSDEELESFSKKVKEAPGFFGAKEWDTTFRLLIETDLVKADQMIQKIVPPLETQFLEYTAKIDSTNDIKIKGDLHIKANHLQFLFNRLKEQPALLFVELFTNPKQFFIRNTDFETLARHIIPHLAGFPLEAYVKAAKEQKQTEHVQRLISKLNDIAHGESVDIDFAQEHRGMAEKITNKCKEMGVKI